MPEGNCEALFPSDGRSTPVGRLAGDEGTRPALGRDAPPVDGSCEDRDTEPVEGRVILLVEGRVVLPVEGRLTLLVEGREGLPVDGREYERLGDREPE